MFPDSWDTQTSAARRKRQREDTQDAIQPPPDLPPGAQENLDIPRQILRNINTVSKAPPTPAELDLDVILSRVPYKDIIENLFSREHYSDVEIPTVSRTYEESFMREPMAGERPCVAGEMCECMMIDPTNPFVGVEFLLPNEVPDKVPQFCVLCARKVTQKLFYDLLFTGTEVNGVIQRFGNLCNTPGEYARECMLICPRNAPLHCMPLPIMSHQRNKYTVRIHCGMRHLTQVMVGHEDFATPSTKEQVCPLPPCLSAQMQTPDTTPQTAELRIQSLLPLPQRRASVEGDLAPGYGWADSAEHAFVPGFPDLSRRLGLLHSRLQTDDTAQTRIDAHLPCAALALEGCKDYAMCVLAPEDAPQLGTLPDLGPLIRECLLVRKQSTTYLASLLPGCMPCPRHTAKPRQAEPASCAVLLNLLLATCLGLYPNSVKRPPFLTRVHLYRRIHTLLTSSPEAQREFVEGHAPLLTLALTEYTAFVIPAYLSPVHSALCAAFPVQPFFAQCPGLADAFRQDHIDTGVEPWHILSAAAQATHDRIARLYKSKCRGVPVPRRPSSSEVPPEGIVQAMQQHVLVRYPAHRLSEATYSQEYSVLSGGDPSVPVGEIHALVASNPLPSNIRHWQQQVFLDSAQRCLRRAHMRCTKHICMHCERRNKRSALRLCTRTGQVVCKVDPQGTQGCVVAMNAIGTVLRIRKAQYIFAPCCGAVREYLGDGTDFSHAPEDGSPCRHALQLRPPHRRARIACSMCDLPALAHGHVHLDTGTLRMAVTHLCQRHTPPEDWLKYVTNRRQFERSCAEWETRMRTLYRRG